jgi:nicotinamidase-related amidase
MLIKADRSSLLVIDLQEKLVPAVAEADRVIANVITLMTAAARLSIPVTVTEHCSDRIGPTVDEVRRLVSEEAVIQKVHFSALAEQALARRLGNLGRPQVIVAGTETHVCVLQTTLELKAAGYDPCLVVDATGTRHGVVRETALSRLRTGGVGLVTTEMVLFEWLARGDTPEFDDILPLIKRTNA